MARGTIRRAGRGAHRQLVGEARLEALDALQTSMGLTDRRTEEWTRQVRQERAQLASAHTLSSESDAAVARMQTPRARAALEAAFNASPTQLGNAALAAATAGNTKPRRASKA